MSLVTQISDLATATGTAIKAERAKIGDLASLSTTAKANLVAAINEVMAAVGAGGTIDADAILDATTIGKALIRAVDAAAARSAIGAGTSNLALGSTSSTAKAGDWKPAAADISDSTSVGRAVVKAADAAAARTAIGAGTSSLVLGTTSSTAKAGDYQPTAANISDATSAGRTLLTAADATAQRTALSVYSIADADSAISNAVAALVDGAPGALDTLNELAAALGDDANFATTISTALGNRLRVDASQSLSGPQQAQGQSNLSVYSRAEIGDVTTDFTSVLSSALA